MDNCKHVLRLSPAADHSVLNPQKWHCGTCGTTESVWACLSCPNVACGRYIEEHAVKHYNETKHPLAIEVNDKYVFCYECDDYILNDNPAGDIKILRSCLKAVATQSFRGVRGRLLRSYSYHPSCSLSYSDRQYKDDDLTYTALWFRRYYMLAKAFVAWRQATREARSKTQPTEALPEAPPPPVQAPPPTPSLRKRCLVPGITGLRNLGNTCYMNAILQVLRHLHHFRSSFLSAQNQVDPKSAAGSDRWDQTPSLRDIRRMHHQYVNSGNRHPDPKGSQTPGKSSSSLSPAKLKSSLSLSRELNALLRVMWSGQWALVSPHKMLYSIWHLIPFFKGYTQQDAQEFLCEFLDKVQSELDSTNGRSVAPSVSSSQQQLRDVITSLFQGELVSELKCLRCGYTSHSYEPFMDLSLEFPDQFQPQQRAAPNGRAASESCCIEEMLQKFTAEERLEGRIYACEQCNRKRRRASLQPTRYTEVQKQLLLWKLPHVLRLHLKRFMWSGRNNRGKIGTHVTFGEDLDLSPFCHPKLSQNSLGYRLSAVVMHHGRGFGCGHYTAYCWNHEADSWVHCNDAKMSVCDLDDVQRAQAYILVYTRKDIQSPSDCDDSEISFNFKHTLIPKFGESKRKMDSDPKGRYALKRRKTTVW